MANSPMLHSPRTVNEDVRRIAKTLNERNLWLIQKVIAVLGLNHTESILEHTLAVEKQGGMETKNGKRRRTPGGVFLQLAKETATAEQCKAIFASDRMSWQKTLEVAQKLAQSRDLGRTETMLATVTGKPRKVTKLDNCVAVAMLDSPTQDIPRGLPQPPSTLKHRVVVFISHRQWNRIEEQALRGLYARGTLLPDPKNNLSIVLAEEVRAVGDQVEKEAKNELAG